MTLHTYDFSLTCIFCYQVSWMRKRDLHILTSSIHTYTGDGRFSVIHPENSEQWDLKVEFVQKRDAGIYECQVNTEPKINLAVQLNVEGSTYKIFICQIFVSTVLIVFLFKLNF